MPTANRIMVPHGIFFSACFHENTPMCGISMAATATKVTEALSKGWRTFSVDHSDNEERVITSNRHSAPVNGPSFLIAPLPWLSRWEFHSFQGGIASASQSKERST